MQAHAEPADVIAAVTHPDPYPYYAALARRPALFYDQRLQLWIAAAPALVRAVMANPDCRVRPVPDPLARALAGRAGEVFGALVRMNDGPRHAAGKRALIAALAQVTPALAARCAARAAGVWLARGVDDVAGLNDFVRHVSVGAMASLLGYDDTQLFAVARLTAQYAAGLSPLAAVTEVATAHEATIALLAGLRMLKPTVLVAALRSAQWQDEHALLANLLGVLLQSYDAGAGLLGNAMVALLRGGQGADLVALTALRDPAIHNTRRFAAADCIIGDVTVKAGETILLVLAAPPAALGFGHGIHACPGEALARGIAAQALQSVLEHQPLAPMAWRYRPSVNARIPELMEVLA